MKNKNKNKTNKQTNKQTKNKQKQERKVETWIFWKTKKAEGIGPAIFFPKVVKMNCNSMSNAHVTHTCINVINYYTPHFFILY